MEIVNMEEKEPLAVSYTRDSKGKTLNKHLNEIVNTIHTSTGSGGNTDCLIAEPLRIPEATAQGYAEATEGDSVNLEQPNSKTRRGRVGKQIANTLTTSCNIGVVCEAKIIEVGKLYEGKHQQDFVQHEDGICRTICTGSHASTPHLLKTLVSEPKVMEEKLPRYRIRKLTPRECFRLMGCDEKTIDIIQAAGISNSQQYKLAGNSIVVDCLYKIFEQLFQFNQL